MTRMKPQELVVKVSLWTTFIQNISKFQPRQTQAKDFMTTFRDRSKIEGKLAIANECLTLLSVYGECLALLRFENV